MSKTFSSPARDRAESNITIANRELVAASRKLSAIEFASATEYKEALQNWLFAKCAALEAYRDREFASGAADSWVNAERLAQQIGTYSEVQERLTHTATT